MIPPRSLVDGQPGEGAADADRRGSGVDSRVRGELRALHTDLRLHERAVSQAKPDSTDDPGRFAARTTSCRARSRSGSTSSASRARSASATATSKSARPSSSARSSSPRAPAKRPTSSRKRCTASPTRAASASRCGRKRRRAWCAPTSSTASSTRCRSPKLYTMGPMFRYERPQKGRYRQFHQLDVEVFGMDDPAVDAEVIDLAWSLIDGARHRAGGARDQLRRLRGLPAAVSGGAARGARRRPAEAVPGLPAPREDESAAHLRLQGRRPTSRSSIGCRTRSTTSASRARRTSPAVQRAPGRRGASRGGSRTGWCAASTTTRARRSRSSARRSARRTRCSAAAATTGWSKILGGPDRTGIGFAAGLERLVLALPEAPRRRAGAAGVRRGHRRRRPRGGAAAAARAAAGGPAGADGARGAQPARRR